MASLTEWERDHLESVHLLFEQARRAILDLKEKEEKDEELRRSTGETAGASGDWLKFRGIVFDLYSVLDYVYYLLYCHFSNKGLPDYSRKSIQFGFPSKPTGVKTSEYPHQDQTKKFIEDKMRALWSGKLGEETHFWREIGEVILTVQPKLSVDSAGNPIERDCGQTKDEESFVLLHFYRNCVTHKDLIRFVPEKSWIEINQTTREHKLVRERQEREGYFYHELKMGYWLQLPELPGQQDNAPRLLLDVLYQLISFVKRTSSKLLCSSLLLPPAKVILCDHLAGCKTDIKFKPAEGMQVAEVTVITETECGEKLQLTKQSGRHKLQADAEEDACVSLLQDLATKSILPNAPYSHFTLHHVQPSPPVQTLRKRQNKTYRMLMHEWNQRLETAGLKPTPDYSGPIQVAGREQHYKVSIKLSIMKENNELLHLESSEHVEIGKNEAKEAAAREMIEECTRLGFIQLH